MIQDLRYAIRMLLKKPGFSVVVLLTLALGIGANVALFSVVNAVLLNPLPFPEPDRLVTFHQSKPNFETGAIPYPNFLDLQRENQTFSAMAISRGASLSLIGVGDPERVNGRFISADYFSLLGVKPELGRIFGPDDDHGGGPPVVLISHNFWSRKFDSSKDIVGKTIRLDDGSYSVVGVIPASFNLSPTTDVYLSIGQWNMPALKSRSAALGLHGIGRLKPGVTVQQAQSDLERIMARLAFAYPEANRGNSSKVIPLKEGLVGNIRPVLLILFAAVAAVLLIACVNVSNLTLARAIGRTQEFAIRVALGAGQKRLARQVIIESTLISLLGGLLGLVVAAWGTTLALAALPTALPRTNEVTLDLRVLLFALGISLLTGLIAGLVPALKASNGRVGDTLKEGGRGVHSGRVRAQGIFVAAEMALAVILLVAAGLMIRSLHALWRVDPGFRADGVLTFGIDMPPSLATDGKVVRSTLRDLSERLNSVPGVNVASLSFSSVPILNSDDRFFWIEGRPKPPSHSEMPMCLFYIVEPGYLNALSIPLKRGRFFTAQDDERSARVVVIDEVLARQNFGSSDPIGQRLNLDDNQGPREIVGVVGHIKQWGLEADDKQTLQAQLYLPLRALSDDDLSGTTSVDVVLRGGNEIGPTLLNSMRQVIHAQNNQNVISNTLTMNDVIARSLGQQRFSMILLGAFAAVALGLASLGIYGVVSYLVGQRTHELGIRIALGASRLSIVSLVVGHGMRMALGGLVVGVLFALLLTRLMKEMLYGVGPTDPLTFMSIAMLLMWIALIACYVPARRATKVDPLVALRHD